MASTAPAGTQAVDRAAALVDLVVRADEPLSFTELSDETGLARSTTSRLLAALERTELIERDAAGGYVAGPLFALHAALHDPWPQIARLARPVLETVGEQTGETVHLGVRRGEDVVHIAQVESTFLLSARDWNQVDVPPHCSSLGKVLYAFDVLPVPSGRLERRTPRTITTREALTTELATIRRQRYATTVDELETGLTGIAAPVEGRDGVFAALGISGPTARLQDRADRIGRLLIEQADALSALLRRRTLHGTDGTKKEGAA
ncbi:IclR family transcriptional regulator [Nocardioides panacis]|uniref:IclR family transcriptional regulator n=1 Tax=Nocardioides panacis TaxID=2849501 RepID=A0A975Y292_9ACTN|nr:IclR family transcriptional regulator [Nocardioides panacis]QWZ10313.1 IclR family transcriptional regulator [Nocardioides panacis]